MVFKSRRTGKICSVMQPNVFCRPVLDHFPILLNGGGVERGLSPFRFENMWLKKDGFKAMVWNWWEGFNFQELLFLC